MNWDELAKETTWKTAKANIATFGDGLYNTFGLGNVKRAPDLYTKTRSESNVKRAPDLYMKTRSESYQSLYEINIKTYWNMWDMYKVFVEKKRH